MKRFFLVISFLFFFLFTPISVLAASSGNLWTDFWSGSIIIDLLSSISNLFNNFIIKNDFQPAIINNNQDNNNYNQLDKDMTTRAIPASNRAYEMGLYLNDVINNGTLDDKTISYACNNSCSTSKIDSNCTDIKLSTLAFYFYKKGEKILYQSGNITPIDYNSGKMENYQYSLVSDGSCYENLYNNNSIIPSGSYQNGDAAAASSEQLNNVIKTPIPNNSQAQEKSSLVDQIQNAIDALLHNTSKNQTLLYRNIIPQKSQDILPPDNVSDFKNSFTDYLHPDNWPDETKEEPPARIDSDLEMGEWEIGGHCSQDPNSTCNAKGSHCRGMSQYGALGMAEAGKGYEDILKFYYGNITLKTIDSTNMMVKIKLDDADICPDGSSLNVEDYLKGLGEMPNYWGSPKTGGFEALKAQAVAARTYAYVHTNKFTKSICNSSKCQVFRCSNIGSKPNFTRAVDETAGQIIVDATSETVFNTEYARSFCGLSRTVTCTNHINPSVDGYQYELQANHGNPPFCK
jgi:hypothetical protein